MNRLGFLTTIVLLCCGMACAQTADLLSINGAFMTPIRPIVRWLGGTVTYDANAKTATLQLDTTKATLTLNSKTATVNGQAVTLEALVIERDGLLYVPLSFVRDTLKVQTLWDTAHTKIAVVHPVTNEKLVLSSVAMSNDELTALFDAAKVGNLAKVKAAVEEHPTLVYTRQKDRTLLAAAVEAGQVEVATYLIKRDADVQVAIPFEQMLTKEYLTLMHLAAVSGNPAMVELMAKHGLSVNTATVSMKITPLLYYISNRYPIRDIPASITIAETLLRLGADPNAAITYPDEILAQAPEKMRTMFKTPSFGTPMMFAEIAENADLEALLLKYGAKPISEEFRTTVIQQMRTARDRARQTICVNNLRQVAMATIMWTQEHEEILPTTETVWTNKDLNAAILKCSADAQRANGYGFNVALSGKPLGVITDPSTTLIFADCKSADNLIRSLDDIDQTRHGKGYCAAFLDGHVEFIKTGTPVNLK